MCHRQSQGDPTAGVALREAKLSPRGSSLQSPILPWPGKFCAEPSPGQAGWREAVSGCAECPQSCPWGCRVSPELLLVSPKLPLDVPKAAPGCPQSSLPCLGRMGPSRRSSPACTAPPLLPCPPQDSSVLHKWGRKRMKK